MIVKVPFSKIQVTSLFLFIGLLSCHHTKSIRLESTVKTTHVKGLNTRGLHYQDQTITTAGSGGIVLSGKYQFGGVLSDTTTVDLGGLTNGITDFRDVYCNGLGTCLFMNSGDEGIIVKKDAKNQTKVVLDTTGVFLDGMDFWDDQNGIVYGDPIAGNFFLAKTNDGGDSWKAITTNLPKALENEGGFAASGTGIQVIGDSTVYFATGLGEQARLFKSEDRGENWIAMNTPMKSGESFGIYSIYFWSANEGVVIGGSYIDSTYANGICQYTNDGGKNWTQRDNGLLGYCSSVSGTKNASLLIATGRMGTFSTSNKGKSWNLLTNSAYYSCYVNEALVVLTGRDGVIEVFEHKKDHK